MVPRSLLRHALPALAALALAAPPARAQWSGAPGDSWWSLPGGGGMASTGGGYSLDGAIGQPASLVLTGGPFTMSGGYWTLPAGGSPTEAPPAPTPVAFELSPLTPNPFTTATVVTFGLPAAARVSAEVFDLAGQRVKALLDETRAAGVHRLAWHGDLDDGRPAPSGVYFVRVRAGASQSTRRVVRVN